MSETRLLSIAGVWVLCAALGVSTARAVDKCLICHEALGDKPSSLFKHDIHRAKGVTCAGCHGGDASSDDMEKAMDRAGAGFIGIPKGDGISAACAGCHADSIKMGQFHSMLPTNQFALLRGSVHGVLSTSGKERIVQCTTCHNAHGIVPVGDAKSPVYPLNIVGTCTTCHSDASYIRTYNPALPVDQLEKYRTSVHGVRNAGGDRKTAECASCHGSHEILSAKDVRSRVYVSNIPATCASCHSNAGYMKGYDIPTDQYEKYARGVHGVALLQKHDVGAPACNSCHGNHGAAPPGVESISKVCGTCHALNAELFSASPHKKGFDDMQMPECETCHSNHEIAPATVSLLGTSPEAVCSQCHTQSERPKGFNAAVAMRQMMDSLEQSEKRAGELVEEAEQKGMEIGEAKFKLRDVRQSRLEARTMVHAFDEGRFRDVVAKGVNAAGVVSEEAHNAIGEYVFRRIGLGIATLSITVLAVALYLYIRRLERRQQKSGTTQYNSRSH